MDLRKRSRPAFCLAMLALILIGGIPAMAQRSDGTISGTVKDPSGAVVPGAAVTITHDQTGAVRTILDLRGGQLHRAQPSGGHLHGQD